MSVQNGRVKSIFQWPRTQFWTADHQISERSSRTQKPLQRGLQNATRVTQNALSKRSLENQWRSAELPIQNGRVESIFPVAQNATQKTKQNIALDFPKDGPTKPRWQSEAQLQYCKHMYTYTCSLPMHTRIHRDICTSGERDILLYWSVNILYA